METVNENSNVTKQRHGCVTAWLIFVIIANSFSVTFSLFGSEMIAKALPGVALTPLIISSGIIGIVNIIFSVLLFQWKKIAFWGFIITSIGASIINFSLGFGIQSLFGLVGIAILYAVLQIKKDDVSAWENLD